MDPYKKTSSAQTLPQSWRAWAQAVAIVGFGGLQVAKIKDACLDGMDGVYALTEVYARAVFETRMGMFFDNGDSMVDVAVEELIVSLYDTQTMDQVRGCYVELGGQHISRVS